VNKACELRFSVCKPHKRTNGARVCDITYQQEKKKARQRERDRERERERERKRERERERERQRRGHYWILSISQPRGTQRRGVRGEWEDPARVRKATPS